MQFLDKIAPILSEREWIINSEVNEFNVLDTPIELTFNVASENKNWFEFSKNTVIDGKEMSFTEITRLLVENQGYIKTSSGFVKVSEQSQKELNTLNSFQAFQGKKTFNTTEMLPLLGISKIEGEIHLLVNSLITSKTFTVTKKHWAMILKERLETIKPTVYAGYHF